MNDRTSAAPADRLPITTSIGFSIGMIGERVFRDAPALVLLLFMTDYLAIPAALAGLAIFLPKLVIILFDPMVGSFSDGLRTRWGRRRPLMFAGAILSSIGMLAFFHVPHFASPGASAVYMGVIVLLAFSGYALFSVPYLTMASEIGNDAGERARLMSLRVLFMATGLVVGSYAGGLVQLGGGGLGGYALMSWALAGVCLLTMLTAVFSTGRTRTTDPARHGLSFVAQARLVFANKRYRLLWSVGFLQKLGEGVAYGSFAYFFLYVIKQPLAAMVLLVGATTVGQFISQPFWLAAARRISRPAIYALGVGGWCLNLVLSPLVAGQSPYWLIPLGIEGGFAAGGFLMVTLAMLSNTIADDSAETGLNREGIYSGFWLAGEKLAFAMGALLVGIILSLFGFRASTAGAHAVQDATAVLGIGFAYCGVNLAIYVVSIVPVLAYRRYEGAPPRRTAA